MFRLPLRQTAVPVPPLRYFSITRVRLADTSYLGDALATDGSIETVELDFDKYSPETQPALYKSPLIFIHGLFGSRKNTRTVAKRLSTRLDRDVYCLDLRNFGTSPHHPRLDYPSFAADVENWIEEQRFPGDVKPIMVGHSMGSKTVMALALRRPDLPKFVVAVDTAPVAFGNTDSMFGKYVNQLRLAVEKYRYTNMKDVDAKLAEVEPSDLVRQFLMTNLNRGKRHEHITSKIPLDIVGDAINKGVIWSWPYDLNISRWTGPTLFIRGTRSKYVPDEAIPEIAKFFPDFEIRDIDSGHWVISEKPDEFMDVLSEFVERREDEDV
ncbi:Abhydrolase domain-containing protein IMO32 [Candida viswanathii]|uniref:Abhydrolase domain-containing protein IMO32 n=1 Tax=Candida viswanathii TaxID=5486 RepID=A0A367YBI5_9ASCO|nr:Abhydrolase domain-containing protein IMO32 [Candida viswanathii]